MMFELVTSFKYRTKYYWQCSNRKRKMFIKCNNNKIDSSLTTVDPLHKDRLTFVLIRINMANVCTFSRKKKFFKLYLTVQWLLFDERKGEQQKKERKKRAVAVQEFISSIAHLSQTIQ